MSGGRLTPFGELDEAVRRTSRMLDESYPPDLCAEARLRRRIDKLGEELGEVFEALGGMVGENPRKGVTHSRDDVGDELLDVAACALGAYDHLYGGQRSGLLALRQLVVTKSERLAAAIGAPT